MSDELNTPPSEPVDAPAPAAAPQTLPEGMAQRIAQQSAPPQTPEPKAAPTAPSTALRDMIGQELLADPQMAMAANFAERICGDKVDVARAFGKAVEEDDPRFIDEAYLRELVPEDADQLIAIAKSMMQVATQRAEALEQKLYAAIPGGKPVVEQASALFQQHASKQEKAAIARLLDSGDYEAAEYALQRIVDFAKGSGKLVVHHDPAFGAAGAEKGLTRAEYAKALMQTNLSESQYATLKAQRQLGLSQGI